LFLLRWTAIGTLALTACFADTAIVSFTSLPLDSNGYPGWAISTVAGVPNQLLLCDDHYDTTTMPSGPYNYDYSILANDLPPAVNTLYFASGPHAVANATIDYEAAAYLMYEYSQVGYDSANPSPGPTAAQNQAATDYNSAIWSLFDPSYTPTPSGSTYQANAIGFVNTAANATFLSSIYLRTAVFTPGAAAIPGVAATSAGQQEFLELLPAPEPATVWLIAGAIGLGLLLRRTRTARA
jgi:hypothetical protein